LLAKKSAHAVNAEQAFSTDLIPPAEADAFDLAVVEELIREAALYSPASFQPFAIDKFGIDI
jgi:hypothetical protein